MNFRKNLKNPKGQAVVEYIVIFIILAVGILIAFGSFSPDRIGIQSVFNKAVDNAIGEINK